MKHERHRQSPWRACSRAALALCVLLAGCDGGSTPERTLRIGNQAEVTSLDPHRSEGVPARAIQRDLFEGLITGGPDGGPVPGVAARWETSEDGLRWTFHLRDDARWSNGEPLTADHFVFSLRRAVTPATGGTVSETLLPIRNAAAILRGDATPETLGVHAPNTRTLVIELETPTPYLLDILMHPSAFPVHPPTVHAHGDDWARAGTLVSNGAYRLAEWRLHSHVGLERNPYYWNAESVAIGRVEYLPIEDQRAELARFEAGDVHITYSIPPGRLEWLRERYPDALHVHPWFGVYYLGLNVTRPPLDDARVRRALSLVIDRELLANEIAATGETAAYAWIPAINDYKPVLPGWTEETLDARIATARALLHAAGYGPERPLTLELLFNTRDRDKRLMSAIAAMWRQALDVRTTLVQQEWKVYLQTRRQRDRTQVFRSGWIGEYADPNTFAEVLHSAHGMNESGWHSARYDALVEEAARTADEDRRRALFAAAEAEIQRSVPVIPLFHYAKARLVSTDVTGYRPNIMDHLYSRQLSWRTPE